MKNQNLTHVRRRKGYAEVAGEAVIRRQIAKQRKQEAIGLSVGGGLSMLFFWICYCIWVNGIGG